MIEDKLVEIAQKFGGRHEQQSKLFKGYQFSSFPVEYHQLDIIQENFELKSSFEFGNTNLGKIQCTVQAQRTFPEFRIERKSHFALLFRSLKSPWKVDCSDELLKSKLIQLINSSGIAEVAQNAAFEPEIHGYYVNGNYVISTRFYLGFDHKEKSFLPLFEFHLKVISWIK